MDFIFEIVFEIVYELIFEGSLDIGTNKKVSMPVRILAMTVFVILVGGFLAIFVYLALAIMKKNPAFGWMFLLFDLFLLGCIIYGIQKRLRNQ